MARAWSGPAWYGTMHGGPRDPHC